MSCDNTLEVLWSKCHDLHAGDEIGLPSNCLSEASFGRRPMIRHRRRRSQTFPKVLPGLAKDICRGFLALRQLPGRGVNVLRAFETQEKCSQAFHKHTEPQLRSVRTITRS